MTLPPAARPLDDRAGERGAHGRNRGLRLHRASGAVPAERAAALGRLRRAPGTCGFAGIVHGQKSTDFIRALVERRFATPITTGKLHRGRMFHVHYKPLWAAIGEPDSRFRKPTAQGRMIERVMLLDAVLDDPSFTWLGPVDWTSAVTSCGISRIDSTGASIHICCSATGPNEDGPVLPGQAADRRAADGRSARVRLPRDTTRRRWTSGCSSCGIRPCSECMFRWTIRLLFPRQLSKARLAYQHAAREHLAEPLEPVDCRDPGVAVRRAEAARRTGGSDRRDERY